MSPPANLAADRDLPSVLRRTEILKGISGEAIERIAAIARPKLVEEGDILYSVGDPAREVYVVAQGRLRFTIGGDGRPAASGSIIPVGDILGWAALLIDQPRRIATVVALEASELVEIEGRLLLRVLEEEPRVGYVVMQRLAKMITASFLEQSSLLGSAT